MVDSESFRNCPVLSPSRCSCLSDLPAYHTNKTFLKGESVGLEKSHGVCRVLSAGGIPPGQPVHFGNGPVDLVDALRLFL